MIYRQLVGIQYLQGQVAQFRKHLTQDSWGKSNKYLPCCKQLIPYDALPIRMVVKRINYYDEETDTMYYNKFCALCHKKVETTSMIGYAEKAKTRDGRNEHGWDDWDDWDDFIEEDTYGEFLDPNTILTDICMISEVLSLHENRQIVRDTLLFCAFRNVIDNLQKDIERYIDYLDKTKSDNCKYCETCDCLRYKDECPPHEQIRSEENCDRACPVCKIKLFDKISYQPSGTVNMSRIGNFGLMPQSYQPNGTINFS